MATRKTKLPNPIRKRDLLFSDAGDSVNLLAHAEGFLETGNTHDAIAFFARAGQTDRLEALKNDAVKQADFPTLYSIAETGIEISADDWRSAGEAGVKNGKVRYAAEAFRRAGDEETATSLENESERQSYTGMRAAQEAEKEDGEETPDSDEDKSIEFDTDSND